MNHTIYRGDTALFRLDVKDRIKGPVDVTGWDFVLSCARQAGGTVAFSVAGTIKEAVNGIVEFELTPTETASVGRFFYDVQGSALGGRVYTVDSGEIDIIQDVTQ